MSIFLTRIDVFLRNNWIGIVLVTVTTGVLGNFVYDFVKPENKAPATSTETKVDPQIAAQAMRTSASSLRAIAANHMRSPLPANWQEAEQLYKNGIEQYAGSDFQSSYKSFKAAYLIYNDLYEQAKYEGR